MDHIPDEFQGLQEESGRVQKNVFMPLIRIFQFAVDTVCPRIQPIQQLLLLDSSLHVHYLSQRQE